MFKIPLGGGDTIDSKRLRELHLTFLCDIGLLCSTSNNSNSILHRNKKHAVLKMLIKFILYNTKLMNIIWFQ